MAAFIEGKYAQAVPSFGSERMGAPVVAFCRIDDQEIRLREPVMDPDILIVQDRTLFHAIDVFNGLSASGYVLINSSKDLDSLGVDEVIKALPKNQVACVPGTRLAQQYVKTPKPSAALLGAFAALTGIVHLESVIEAIQEKFPNKIAEANCIVARLAYEHVGSGEELKHA